MVNRSYHNPKSRAAENNRGVQQSKRVRRLGLDRRDVKISHQVPFVPPEDWYEPSEYSTDDYRIVVQDPGAGFQHVVTHREVRDRLSQLPPEMLKPLEVVQLSRMTRKKCAVPCYGMQWGCALYLYPIESGRVEYFHKPPQQSYKIETRDVWRSLEANRRQFVGVDLD